MTEALEEDYYNLAALWSLVNDYYEENKNFDSVECLEWNASDLIIFP